MTISINLQLNGWDADFMRECNLVAALIGKVVSKPVIFTDKPGDADVTLLYPYAIKRSLLERTLSSPSKKMFGQLLREEAENSRVIVVVPENLYHPNWTRLRTALLRSDVPRVTHLPEKFDSRGVRLPYWWNYVSWPELPRPEASYSRYGRMYSLDKLLEPLKRESGAKNRAIWITSSLFGMREAVVDYVRSRIKVDIWGRAGRPFKGPKLGIMRRYQYYFAAENSIGVGYDTEKIPEAWDAGLVPIGLVNQPESDFEPRLLSVSNWDAPFRFPLLAHRPTLDPVLQYLDRHIR